MGCIVTHHLPNRLIYCLVYLVLVGGLNPLKNMLGWWNSQYMENKKCAKPQTSIVLEYLVGFMGYSFIVYGYIYVYNVEPLFTKLLSWWA